MTLHQAILEVLIKAKKALTTLKITEVLNATSLYTKKDGSEIKKNQISARVKKYPQLFNNANGVISLKSKTGFVSKKDVGTTNKVSVTQIEKNSTLLMKVLMNEKDFKSVQNNKHLIPDEPGLYCIRVKDPKVLKMVFSNALAERKHTILYVGIATKSLQKRFLNQELRAKGHGTFFRSLGAILGYVPVKGSLIGKSNQNNYKFSNVDEQNILNWIDENLIINWISVNDNLKTMEKALILEHLPLLNIAGNPGALNNVIVLRNKCKEIARGNI